MDRNFLLTWSDEDGNATFDWFESEEEMRFTIEQAGIKEDDIFEMIEVLGRREIKL